MSDEESRSVIEERDRERVDFFNKIIISFLQPKL